MSQQGKVTELVDGKLVERAVGEIPKAAVAGWRMLYVNSGNSTQNADTIRAVLGVIARPDTAKVSFLGDSKTVYLWYFDPA